MSTHPRPTARLRAELLEGRCVPASPHLPPPGALAVSGGIDGSLLLLDANAAGLYSPTPVAALNPFSTAYLTYPVPGGFNIANTRSAIGDVNGDGYPDTVVVTGPGVPLRLAVVSGADDRTLLVPPVDPFGGNFTGGGFVAVGDFEHIGRDEIVVTPDEGGGPRVEILALTPAGLVPRANFFGIDDPNFRGGTRPAVGDVDADGIPDLVVAAGFGGGPRIAVFDGSTVLGGSPDRLVNDFFAFEPTLLNGAYVAVGDVNGDGFDDIVIGGGPGGGPRVLIVSGAQLLTYGPAAAVADPLSNFFVAGDIANRSGVRVAVKDADGDHLADVVVGSGDGLVGEVRVYLGKNFIGTGEPPAVQDLHPFGVPTDDNPVYTLADGVFVG